MLWKVIVQLLKLCNKQQRRHAKDNSSFMKLTKVFLKFKKIWKFCLRSKECWWKIVAFKHVIIKWTQKVWRSKHSKEETWYKISSTSSFEEVPWSLLLLENWFFFFFGGGAMWTLKWQDNHKCIFNVIANKNKSSKINKKWKRTNEMTK